MPPLERPQPSASLEAALKSLGRSFDLLETFEPWHEIGSAGNPAFNASWGNVGGAEETAAFRKAVDGQVWLKGYLTANGGPLQGNGTGAFSLPAGYRPKVQQRLPCVGSGAGVFYTGHLLVGTNGLVTITLRGLAANAAVADVTLTGSFRLF